jgi:hypothetical protein
MSLLLLFLQYIWLAFAGLTLIEDYTGTQFFDKMQFFHGQDPTNGFVQYADFRIANRTGLVGFIEAGSNAGAVYLGADYRNVTSHGRPSVRVSSNRTYGSAIFIADIGHMPASTCGSWPAFWLLGTAELWPAAGEVDIVENINLDTANRIALHVNGSFVVDNTTDSIQGRLLTANGDVAAANQSPNTGAVIYGTPDSFGTPYNAYGGGIWITEVALERNEIAMWFFPRSDEIPDHVLDNPDPSVWGKPLANFTGKDLDFASIINLSFCGDWAGHPDVWRNSRCAKLATTCNDYVANNPDAFTQAYWAFNSLRVYVRNANVSDCNGTAGCDRDASSTRRHLRDGYHASNVNGTCSHPRPANRTGTGPATFRHGRNATRPSYRGGRYRNCTSQNPLLQASGG